MLVSSELYHEKEGKLYSHGMCLGLLSDGKLRITQVGQGHLSDLSVSHVWSSDRKSAALFGAKFSTVVTVNTHRCPHAGTVRRYRI